MARLAKLQVQKREDAQGCEQPKANGSGDHDIFLLLLLYILWVIRVLTLVLPSAIRLLCLGVRCGCQYRDRRDNALRHTIPCCSR